jgi:hypothetical protein
VKRREAGARLEGKNLKIQNILLLGLASLVVGCGGQLTSDEAGLLDAVVFVMGGQEEGIIPHGFETRWRRTVRGKEIEYQSTGPYPGFDEANDPHHESRYVRVGLNITSPQKCVFKTVVSTAYSKGASNGSFNTAVSETAVLDLNKAYRLEIERSDFPSVVIEGAGLMCKAGKCQDDFKAGILSSRQDELARMIETKQRAIDFIRRACPIGIAAARNR